MEASKFKVEFFEGFDPTSEPGREVERSVFFEAFGNTSELLKQEYDPFEPMTVFLTVTDLETNCAAGSMRILVGPLTSLKSVLDISREPWSADLSETLQKTSPLLLSPRGVDIATMSVSPGYRGRGSSGEVSMALYHASSRFISSIGLDTSVTVFDIRVYHLVNRVLGGPWQRYHGIEPASYLGSSRSLPVWCSNDNIRVTTRSKSEELYQSMFGDDTSGPVLYPSWDEIRERFSYRAAG